MLGPGRLHTRKPRPSSYGVSSWIMERHLRRPFSGPQEVPGGAAGAPTHGLPVLARSCCSDHTVPWPAAGPAWTFLWVSGEMAGVKHNSSLSLPRDFLKQTTTTCQTRRVCEGRGELCASAHVPAVCSLTRGQSMNRGRRGVRTARRPAQGPAQSLGWGVMAPQLQGAGKGSALCRSAEVGGGSPQGRSRGRRAGLGLRLSLRGCPVSTASDGGSG